MKNKNKITNMQYTCLIGFPIFAFFSGLGTHNIITIAQTDAYFTVIFSYLLGFIPFLIFLFILNYKKELAIKDKVKYLFGPILGTIINYLIYILFLISGTVLLHCISDFAISQFLAETPIIIFMILIGLVIIYNVNLGIENICRVSLLFLGIIIAITFFSTSGVIPHFEASNIKPYLENGLIPPLKGGIILTLTNVIPIFSLLCIPKDKVNNNNKTNKTLTLFYTVAFTFDFIAIFLTIGALGIYLCNIYQFPEYTVLKKISLFNFIERVENFVYIKWILSSITYLALVTYYISSGIKEESKKLLPTIIVGLMIFLALKIFKNNTIFYNFIQHIYPYTNLLLFSIFFIISINILIRKLIKLDSLT